jgi:molybdopterin synthase sulfur carrier subunit
MINVLFFARIREQLGVGSVAVEYSDALRTLGDLQQHLVAKGGADWQSVLAAANVLRAVNQEEAALEQPLADGDEVAFFPPVTGG